MAGRTYCKSGCEAPDLKLTMRRGAQQPTSTSSGYPCQRSRVLPLNRTFPSAAFAPITWTAVVSGGNPPLQYQFWRLKQGVGWSLVQDYSALNTYSWTPTAAETGTYVLQVWVRSTGSTAAYDAWSGTGNFAITAPAPVQITTFGSSVGLPVAVGTPITWNVSAIGGTPPIHFKFFLLNVGTGVWSILQNYSTSSSVTWTPMAAGSYVVQVWARSATSTAPYEDGGAPAPSRFCRRVRRS